MIEKMRGGISSSKETKKTGHSVTILVQGEKDSPHTLTGKEHFRKPITITDDQLRKIQNIVGETGGHPLGEDKDEGPSVQDYLDSVQILLNHVSLEKLKKMGRLSEDSLKFIKESGLFLI